MLVAASDDLFDHLLLVNRLGSRDELEGGASHANRREWRLDGGRRCFPAVPVLQGAGQGQAAREGRRPLG